MRRAAELLSSGKIGRRLNARIVSTTSGFGPEMPSIYDYFNKTSSGANLLTITAGHTLDVVEAVLGPIIEFDARTEIIWPSVKLTDVGKESVREAPDHIDVKGKTWSGAAFTADIDGGLRAEDAHFSFEIIGSEGWLSLAGDHPYGFQAGDLKLTSNVGFEPPEEARSTVALWARQSTWQRCMLILFVICMRARTAHPALSTHFTMPG